MRRHLLSKTLRPVKRIYQSDTTCVLLVEDLASAARVALKINQSAPSNSTQYDPLAHEFDILARLQHPNIIRSRNFFRFFPSDSSFSMDFLGTSTLASVAPTLSSTDIRSILAQLARALEYLQTRNIVHGDISPSNILVHRIGIPLSPQESSTPLDHRTSDSDLHATLIDFGSAGYIAERPPPNRKTTTPFAAPEIFDGCQDQRADIYSLGMVFKKLFDTECDPSLQNILSRMIHPDADLRFKHAGEILVALSDDTSDSHPLESHATRRSYFQLPPFIGRKQELEFFRAALVQVFKTASRHLTSLSTFYLLGGVGKSRLMLELSRLANLSGAQVLHIECKEHGLDPIDTLFSLKADPLSLHQHAPQVSEADPCLAALTTNRRREQQVPSPSPTHQARPQDNMGHTSLILPATSIHWQKAGTRILQGSPRPSVQDCITAPDLLIDFLSLGWRTSPHDRMRIPRCWKDSMTMRLVNS